MKSLIIGASGFVGSYLSASLKKRGFEIVGTYHSYSVTGLRPLDIRNSKEIETLIAGYKPDVICLCAANPNVDYCEDHAKETAAVNVEGVRNTAAAAAKAGAQLVYFSSDYVFDGVSGPYRETDIPNPISEYGRQKLEAEKIVLNASKKNLILRVTVLYGWEQQGKNFIVRLLKTLEKGDEIRVPNDQIGTPTLVPNMTEIAAELIFKKSSGVYHLAGKDCIDRYRFALEAAKIFGFNSSKIKSVATHELLQKAKRPLKAGLLIEKVSKEIPISSAGITEGLQWLKNHRKVPVYE